MIADGHYDAFIGAPLTSGMCAGLGFINSAPAIQAGLAYAQHPTKSGGDPGQQTFGEPSFHWFGFPVSRI